jgi:hypothetical protein
MEQGNEMIGEQERFEYEQWNAIQMVTSFMNSCNEAQLDETMSALYAIYDAKKDTFE